MEDGRLPVYIEASDLDAGEVAELMGMWDDAWNEQMPEPAIKLFLKPTKREW